MWKMALRCQANLALLRDLSESYYILQALFHIYSTKFYLKVIHN